MGPKCCGAPNEPEMTVAVGAGRGHRHSIRRRVKGQCGDSGSVSQPRTPLNLAVKAADRVSVSTIIICIINGASTLLLYCFRQKKQLINLTFLPLMQNFPSKIGQFKEKNHINRLQFSLLHKIQVFTKSREDFKMTATPSINCVPACIYWLKKIIKLLKSLRPL